jgi:hypothetical protein
VNGLSITSDVGWRRLSVWLTAFGLLSVFFVLTAIMVSCRWSGQWIPCDRLNLGIAAGQLCVSVESEPGSFEPSRSMDREDWPLRVWPMFPESYVQGTYLVALPSFLTPAAGILLLGFVLSRYRRPRVWLSGVPGRSIAGRRRRLNRSTILQVIGRAISEGRFGPAGLSITCPRCGYDLRLLSRDICPECGRNISLPELAARQYDLDPAARMIPRGRWHTWFRRTERLAICAIGFCVIGFLAIGLLVEYERSSGRDVPPSIAGYWSELESFQFYLLAPTGLLGAASGIAGLMLETIYKNSIARQRHELLTIIGSLCQGGQEASLKGETAPASE